jgi:uncharacterized repeat protein (TIGR02543 family)
MMRNWLSNPFRRLVALFAVLSIAVMFLPVPAEGVISPFNAVTFHENDSTSDSVNAFESQNTPSDLTLFADLSPTFSNTGSVFNGWNTSANGSGTSYANGSEYSFLANLDLFAQWTQGFNAVTFNENASTVDTINTFESMNSPSALTLFANLTPTFAKTGYSFAGWNTSPDGNGTPYENGALYGFASNLALYAQWTQNTTTTTTTTTLPGSTFTVSFNDGGGSGILNPVTVASGSSVQLPNSGSLTYLGFSQTGWFTALTGGSLIGLGGASFVPTSSITLYAQWTAGVADTISFSSNGGTGIIPAMTSSAGTSLTLPTGVGLLDTGFVFAGWSPTSTSQSLVYSPGAPYAVVGSVTLYAVWTVAAKAPVVSQLAGSVGPFVRGSSVLGTTLKRQVHNIASGMRARDYASASMFGYALANEKVGNVNTLSARRATAVENYLRSVLASLHHEPVVMHATGEGLVRGTSNSAFRRVEVFVKL